MVQIRRLFDLLELYANDYSGKADAFNYKKNGTWRKYSAGDYVSNSDLISLGLLSLGIRRGDRIATIMNNSPIWNFFDMGIMQVGAVQVPLYPAMSEENYKYILHDAQVQLIIVSNNAIYQRIKNSLPETARSIQVFSVEKVKGLRHWKEILELGKEFTNLEELETIKKSILPTHLATIIYTSGTTGRPKGVMLSHLNFISNFTTCADIRHFETTDRVLSFLPLCHIYERMLNYLFQSYGMSIYYAESFDKLGENIREVKPHTFATVPRVLEKIYDRIVARGRRLIKPVRVLFFWALRQGHKYELDHTKGWFYDIKIWLANLLIFRSWRTVLGNNVKVIISGGASLHPRLTRLFWAARIPVVEGYGLTETGPVISVFNFKKGGVRFGTVGAIIPGVEVKIADDGEILCRGPNIMLGYYNRPERTQEVIDSEGWFHTGDIGILEEGKYLKITDRKKEIFKTSTGKYIAPQVIEQKFKQSPFIEQIMVMGENRKYTAALIVPNFEYLRNWCEVKHMNFVSNERAVRNPRIIHRFKVEVNRINQDLGQTEKIKKFRLLHQEWTLDSGELSLTLKLRRKFILEKYHEIIEETYRSTEFNYKVDLY
jgi:long-chain acyl-CoA synthetase